MAAAALMSALTMTPGVMLKAPEVLKVTSPVGKTAVAMLLLFPTRKRPSAKLSVSRDPDNCVTSPVVGLRVRMLCPVPSPGVAASLRVPCITYAPMLGRRDKETAAIYLPIVRGRVCNKYDI